MRSKLYFVQDKRQYVGNDMLFWAKNSNGYTTNLDLAEIFTEEEIGRFLSPNSRETDIVWPMDYILSISSRTVDMQHVDHFKVIPKQTLTT